MTHLNQVTNVMINNKNENVQFNLVQTKKLKINSPLETANKKVLGG